MENSLETQVTTQNMSYYHVMPTGYAEEYLIVYDPCRSIYYMPALASVYYAYTGQDHLGWKSILCHLCMVLEDV